MKKTELAATLQQAPTRARPYGVVKIDDPDWQHITFVIPPPPPHAVDSSLPYKSISSALKVLSALPAPNEMSELDKLINYLFVRREVVQSSRLEGTWSTIDHALTPCDDDNDVDIKDEHQAVRSYAKALENVIDEAIQKKERIFSAALVCELQKKIVEHDPNSKGTPGKLRTPGEPGSIVTIGGLNRKEDSIYNPVPPAEVKRCLGEVLAWLGNKSLAEIGDAGTGLTLPVRLAIGHAHFEAVHPFTDGNGRTGRVLWSLQMVCSGHMPLYLSGYVEAMRVQYIKALEEAQKRLNYNPLIEFICNAIIESSLEVKKSKEIIKSFHDIWKKRGQFRRNSAAERSLQLLLHKPIITASVLQRELGISGPASTNAINQLVNKKIIRHRRFENRKPVYAAEELIQILSRPFGGEIELALEKAKRLFTESAPQT
jgi:Fic family protein